MAKNTTSRTARARANQQTKSSKSNAGLAADLGSAAGITTMSGAPYVGAVLGAGALAAGAQSLYQAKQASDASKAAKALRPAENAKALQHFKNMQNKLQTARQGIGPAPAKPAPAKPAVGGVHHGWSPAARAAALAARMAKAK